MAAQASTTSETGQTTSERFFKFFQHEITALQDQMNRLGDTALVGGERKDATDHCLAGITRLSSEVKDASGTLPAYDLRTYTEAIKALQEKLAETQAQHAPKQKFAFKTRKNESAVSLHEAAQLAEQKQKSMLRFGTPSGQSSYSTTPVHSTPPNEQETSKQSDAPDRATKDGPGPLTQSTTADTPVEEDLHQDSTSASVFSRSNAHIILPASANRAHTSCTLSALRNCCVDLSIPTTESAPFASLTIIDVQNSLLLCGSVAGPAHITNVRNSTIMISCRQFRMHDCENVDIYLYCTSRPIIEDCKDLRFATMPDFYTDHLHSSNPVPTQAIGTNLWDSVDDFKWLRAVQSPNWMILPTEERVSDVMWKSIIPGKPGMSLDEILDAASIRR